jgi:hypothetical protein
MSRLTILTRSLTASAAIVALAAPMASARPVDTPQTSHKATPSVRTQDLRHLQAGQLQTGSLAGSSSAHPTAGAVLWSYDYEAQAPETHAVAATDDDTPWVPIGLGVAGMCLLIGTGAAFSTRVRVRPRKTRIAA